MPDERRNLSVRNVYHVQVPGISVSIIDDVDTGCFLSCRLANVYSRPL